MSRFDIELLFIFDEIYKSRNVTRAAENLGLPQSTVSIGLGKLRTHFGDRLFARTSKGMEPTPRAQNAVQDVRAAIAAWQHALADQPVFDPAASTREFAICMTDISEIVLLPTLLNHLQQIGPRITLDVSKIATDTPARLEGGEVDLAVGFMPHLESGFYQQKLFDQHFVCLVASSHPRIRDTITVAEFLAEGHIEVKSSGTGHSIVEKVLAAAGVQRRIVLKLPSFLGVSRIVAETEYIVTVPYRYALQMRDHEAFRILPLPVALPSFSVKQHWHERYHEDASNRWLRQTMAQLFGAGESTTLPIG